MKWHPLPANALWCMGGIVVLLAAASVIVFLLRILRPNRDCRELVLRIKGWWVIVVPFFSALLLSRGIAIIFFALVSYLALKEYLSLIPTRRADRRVLFWAYFAVPVQYWWIHNELYGMFIIFIPVYMFLFLAIRMALGGETTGFLKAAGTLHWGLMCTVFSLSHVGYLLALPGTSNAPAGGVGLVLYLVALTELNDVAQYVCGKAFGRHKVIPSVSPGKSMEGVIGGVIVTVVCACLLAPVLTPLSRMHAFFAGLIIGPFGFLGDVTVSAVKRDIGIKDTGTLLPGHGGILDRVDSLTVTAPAFLHFVRFFYF
ncbi:MAG: phosphatidate cytidylyltransferase [Lentisphaerae bacterium]|nr:phosphatidate cytidylyltransferase [Lentisphaerota bacterium]